MARHFAWALAALLLVPSSGGAAQPPTPQQAPAGAQRHQGPFLWWVDDKSRGELGITDAQSAAIEQIWQKSLPRLKDLRVKLDRMDNHLSDMVRDEADEGRLVAEIDKVEAVRTEAYKERTLMLYRMNRVLTPDQRLKLKAMRDRMEAARRGSDRRHP
jgi:Spy/CpxP family protein refolding chaperone